MEALENQKINNLFLNLNTFDNSGGRIYKESKNGQTRFFQASGFFSSIFHFIFSERLNSQDLSNMKARVMVYFAEMPEECPYEVEQVINKSAEVYEKFKKSLETASRMVKNTGDYQISSQERIEVIWSKIYQKNEELVEKISNEIQENKITKQQFDLLKQIVQYYGTNHQTYQINWIGKEKIEEIGKKVTAIADKINEIDNKYENVNLKELNEKIRNNELSEEEILIIRQAKRKYKEIKNFGAFLDVEDFQRSMNGLNNLVKCYPHLESKMAKSYFSLKNKDGVKQIVKEIKEEVKNVWRGGYALKLESKINNNTFGLELLYGKEKEKAPPKLAIHLSKKNGQPYRVRIYKVIKELGQGAFGTVYQVVNIADKRNFALKVEKKEEWNNYPLSHEIEIHRKFDLESPNIVSGPRYKNVKWEEDAFLSPLYDGTLKEYTESNKKFNSNVLFNLLDLFLGLEVIHNKNLFHNDLHTKNIFYRKTKNANSPQFYIADFGKTGEEARSEKKQENKERELRTIEWLILTYIHETVFEGKLLEPQYNNMNNLHHLKNKIYEKLERKTDDQSKMLCKVVPILSQIISGDLPYSTLKSDLEKLK